MNKTLGKGLWCGLLLGLPLAGYAQQTTLTLRNSETLKPVAFAYVNLYSDTSRKPVFMAQSDENGRLTLNTAACPCRMEIAATGYEPLRQPLVLKNDALDIALTKKSGSLDEVVVTGVSKPVKPQDALATYKIISNEQMQAQGAVTLNDAVNTQLNMSVSNDAILGSGIRMQGLSGDKVKILIDGMPINGREGGNIDMGQLNLYNVDHIEIAQGPMSIMYGSDALGGVINLITKEHYKPRELVVNANYETVGKYNFNLYGARKFGDRHNISIGGGRNFFEGWKYIDTVTPHRQQLFKPKEQYMGNLGYSYNAPSGFRIRFASDFLNEKVTNKGVAFINPYIAYASDDYYYTLRSLNRLSLQGKLGRKGSWQSMNSYAIYRHVKNSYQKDLVTLNQTESTDPGAQDTSTFREITLRGFYNNNIGKLNYTAGYDVDLQTALSQKISKDTKNVEDYAAFAIAALPLFKDRLTLQASVRASYNTKYSVPLMPAYNILYKPADKWQLRASYAKGFRVATLKEMYLQFFDANHHITGNPNLKPEQSHHVQVSSSYQVYKQQADYLQVLLTGFYNDVRNGIVLVNQRPEDSNSIDYQYGNLTREKNMIGNLQLEGQWKNLHFTTGYAYAYTFAQEDQYSAFNTSEVTANLQYYFKPLKTGLNLFFKHTGEQPFLQADISGSATYNGKQPAYNFFDASLEHKFWKKKLQVIAGVKNILNVQTITAAGVQTGGAHSGGGTLNFLPRSIFTTVRLSLY